MPGTDLTSVETVLTAARKAGRRSLVTYVTGGIRDDWTVLLDAMIEAGADAVEIGLPFSDPMLDGPVIQQASAAAIGHGATLPAILAELRRWRGSASRQVPLIAMTYANHAYGRGLDRFCQELAGAGIAGTIIPDLPMGETEEYLDAAARAGLDATLMVTPATPPDQMLAIARRSRGFLYVMSVMATTGPRPERDDERAWATAARALRDSPRPVLIGFGIDTAQRAAAAACHADGVIVASALVRQVLDGAGPGELARSVSDLRAAVDGTVVESTVVESTVVESTVVDSSTGRPGQ
jgi:tryptophan synthase alpha chain